MLKVENNVVEVKTNDLPQALTELMILTHTIAVKNNLTIAKVHNLISSVNKRVKLSKDHVKFSGAK